MTRFARAEGSKSCNKKIPEEATPWSELKGGMRLSKTNDDGVPPVESESGKVQKPCSSKQNSWSVIEEHNVTSSKGHKRNLNQTGDQRPSKKTLPFLSGKTGWKVDDFDSKSIESKRSLPTEGSSLEEIDKKKSKRAFRISQMEKKKEKKCFQCMQVGHVLAMCPLKKECDICFICGSPEHRVKQCKQRKPGQSEYKYATCFICKEEGHLSSCCPDNPSGLYPYGGGCRECGDVTHFVRDCPKLKKEKKSHNLTVPKLSNDVEGLPKEKICSVKKLDKKIKTVTF